MNYKDLADLIFPNAKEISYYEEKYPNRNLKEGAVVTRYAPSPTGVMHIGGLYQALIAKKLSKQTDGVFFLRIEDTDQKREIENGVSEIVSSLKDFGMEADEGMLTDTEEKGNYGPYKQSLRKEIYQAYAKYLIEQGKAYPCFCTPEDVEQIRQKQESAKIRPGYYGVWAKCRNITVEEAIEKNVFGTKMRSVIYEPNADGIKAIVEQQFEFAKIICDAGLVPIIEPEVDINAPEKEKCEEILKEEIKKKLNTWNSNDKIMFKFTIPTVANHYLDLYDYVCVVRIVALSGGYDVDTAVELLSKNNKMIASFSRALLQDLNANQSQDEFDKKLNDVIVKIYNASIT